MKLGSLLIMRPAQGGQDKARDYENAEGFLLDAVEIFRKAGPAARPRQREALLLLQTLYSSEHWDDPESLSRIDAALQALDAATPSTDAAPSAERPKEW